MQNTNIFLQHVENDLGIITSVPECGSLTCPDVLCLVEPASASTYTQQPSVDGLCDDLTSPVASFAIEQQPPISISTPQLPVKPIPKSKTPTKKVSLTQDIQETQLEVLKKESRKLDFEIENLLLARKKLKLEIEEVEERRGSK